MSDDADRHYLPRRFLQRLASVPEPSMQEALWGEALLECSPPRTAALVLAALHSMARRTRNGRAAYLALVRLVERRPQARLALKIAARHEPTVAHLVAEGYPFQIAEAKELPGPPLKTDREITLGERRSWARRPDRDLIDRLLLDPDPVVVGNLLQNPRIIERDVLRIVSRRPIGAEVLACVFHNPRWGRRPVVQQGLVLNPYTPILMAAGLVALLDLAQVREIASDPSAHPVVRARAEAALEWRQGLSPEPVEPEEEAPEEEGPEAEADPEAEPA